MPSSRQTSRARRQHRATLEPRLRAYSTTTAAALATGAVALGATATAHAQFVTISLPATSSVSVTPITNTHSTSAVANLHVAIGARDLDFRLRQSNTTRHTPGQFYADGRVQASFANQGKLVTSATHAGVRRFAYGDQIGPSAAHFGNNKFVAHTRSTHPASFRFGVGVNNGNFNPTAASGTKTGYIGFAINSGVSTHYSYGWLHIKVTVDSNKRPVSISLVANGNNIVGAYRTDGLAISAGQVAAVPEPASVAGGLALFALGAVGIRELRRRRREAPAAEA